MWWLFTGLVIIMYQSSYLTSMKCVKHGDVPDHKDDAVSADSKTGEAEDSEKRTPLLAIIPIGYPIILAKPQTIVEP